VGADLEKLGGAKMERMSSIRMQSLVEVGGRAATEHGKQWCFLFVCLYCCHAGWPCPEKRPDFEQYTNDARWTRV